MSKDLISLSDLLAKAEAATTKSWEGHIAIEAYKEDAEFIAAASPDVVKALVEALNAASKWSMSPSTFLGRHGLKP